MYQQQKQEQNNIIIYNKLMLKIESGRATKFKTVEFLYGLFIKAWWGNSSGFFILPHLYCSTRKSIQIIILYKYLLHALRIGVNLPYDSVGIYRKSDRLESHTTCIFSQHTINEAHMYIFSQQTLLMHTHAKNLLVSTRNSPSTYTQITPRPLKITNT